jgi:hypothetical protein
MGIHRCTAIVTKCNNPNCRKPLDESGIQRKNKPCPFCGKPGYRFLSMETMDITDSRLDLTPGPQLDQEIDQIISHHKKWSITLPYSTSLQAARCAVALFDQLPPKAEQETNPLALCMYVIKYDIEQKALGR